jgi:hypothetical protein
MIDDIYAKATGDFEVIAVLDGYWPNPPIKERPNLTLLHNQKPKGLRAADNAAAGVAKGKYLLKADAHCCFGAGFDEILQQDIEDNWIVVMRRYSLDPDTWDRNLEKSPSDYSYLDCCWTNPEFFQMHGVIWRERAKERVNFLVDETMSWQGSAWLMSAEHFHKRLHGMDETPGHYGMFAQEPQEIGMKTWLGGGAVMVNKKTWYAHLHKGKRFGRMYGMDMNEVRRGHMYSAHYWAEDQWPERVRDFGWLVDHFWPLPKWPDNWRDYYEGRLKYEGSQ